MNKIKFKKTAGKIFALCFLVFLAVSFSFIFASAQESNIQFTCQKFNYPWCSLAGNNSLASLVDKFYVMALGIAGASAFAMFVYGAILYTTSGVVGKKQEAMDIIKGAIFGVLLLLGAYLLLKTIDEDLVNLGRIETELNESAPTPVLPTIEGESIFQFSSTTIEYALGSGTIAGTGSMQANSITMEGGAITVSGLNTGENNGQHRISADAYAAYSGLNNQISAACQQAGYTCNAAITSTLTGDHLSQCHREGNSKSGTCADFVIQGCGGDRNCLGTALVAINGSQYVTSCLNEYAVDTAKKTGDHVHCNFATTR